MPTFSVIIPHHNLPRLLDRCLASIPLRDDMEVIIVDDNSDPAIVDFDNFPGHDRPDVKLIFSKEGHWAGNARNKGIKAATGKWLIFADSDDFFNFCFPDLLDKYADSDADIVFFRANSLDSETYSVSDRECNINRYFDTYLNGDKQYGDYLLRYAWGEPWAKFYRASLIRDNNILFDDTPIHEDTIFTYSAGHLARTIVADPHCIYCVTTRQGSLSKSQSDEKLLTKVAVFARKEKFNRDNNILYSDPIDNFHYDALVDAWRRDKALYRKGLSVAAQYVPVDRQFRLKLLKTLIRHYRFSFYLFRQRVKKSLGLKK